MVLPTVTSERLPQSLVGTATPSPHPTPPPLSPSNPPQTGSLNAPDNNNKPSAQRSWAQIATPTSVPPNADPRILSPETETKIRATYAKANLVLVRMASGPTSLDEVALAVQRALGTVLASACWDPRFRPSCLLGFRSASEVNRLRQLQVTIRDVPVLFDFCDQSRPVTYLGRFVPPFIAPENL